MISFYIARELALPVIFMRTDLFARFCLMVMCMPKVAINENGDVLAGKSDIRCAREFSIVLSIAQSMLP